MFSAGVYESELADEESLTDKIGSSRMELL